jgi:hypothetical protein
MVQIVERNNRTIENLSIAISHSFTGGADEEDEDEEEEYVNDLDDMITETKERITTKSPLSKQTLKPVIKKVAPAPRLQLESAEMVKANKKRSEPALVIFEPTDTDEDEEHDGLFTSHAIATATNALTKQQKDFLNYTSEDINQWLTQTFEDDNLPKKLKNLTDNVNGFLTYSGYLAPGKYDNREVMLVKCVTEFIIFYDYEPRLYVKERNSNTRYDVIMHCFRAYKEDIKKNDPWRFVFTLPEKEQKAFIDNFKTLLRYFLATALTKKQFDKRFLDSFKEDEKPKGPVKTKQAYISNF